MKQFLSVLPVLKMAWNAGSVHEAPGSVSGIQFMQRHLPRKWPQPGQPSDHKKSSQIFILNIYNFPLVQSITAQQ
jgi:hypothetical protein